jgi:hypothetical protein
MPFKSKAQRRKFAELLVRGDISEETYEEWNRSTGSASLPERVHPKGPGKKKKAKKSTKAKKARARKAPRGRAKGKGKRYPPT